MGSWFASTTTRLLWGCRVIYRHLPAMPLSLLYERVHREYRFYHVCPRASPPMPTVIREKGTYTNFAKMVSTRAAPCFNNLPFLSVYVADQGI